jgi:hypothetical protein
MALRYEWGWDFANYVASPAFTIDDDGSPHVITFSTGTYIHTSITDVIAPYDEFAAALESAINDVVDGSNSYTVTWNGTTGYTIAADTVNFTLSFSGDAGLNMRRILGFTGNMSAASEQESNCRPYYLIIPAMPGRSQVSDEYQPEGIAEDASSDDGHAYQIAKATSEIYCDWTQMAETDQAPSSFSSEGTYVFEREATTAIPWTYQHAFTHGAGGMQPFLVIEGSTESVHELRAEGVPFHPQRFSAPDYALWNIPFRTRLLGYV